MDEKRIRKNLRRATFLVVLAGVLLLTAGGLVTHYLRSMLRSTVNTQMETETKEYKERLQQRIKTDFQTLYTLSSFLEFSEAMDQEAFAQGLYESNNHNDFITMTYFEKEGLGIRAILNHSVSVGVELDTLAEELQDTVRKAWEGESAISQLFHEETLDDILYVYAVPVYRDGQVIGALTASHSASSLSDILNTPTILNGEGYIHLLNRNGEFLLRSHRQVIPEALQSVFEGEYISSETRTAMQDTMRQSGSGFFSFQYQDRDYQIYLEPLEVNGWYLFCVNTTRAASGPVYQLLLVTRGTFSAILALAVFLIAYGYRQLRKNNRELIRAAYQDPLTGADNLLRFRQNLQDALTQGRTGSIVSLNLRQFKFINELFGREQADGLLRLMRRVLDRNIREDEFFCRNTADSFYLFLQDTQRETLFQRLEILTEQVRHTTFSQHHDYRLQLYCGVATDTPELPREKARDILLGQAAFALAKARTMGLDQIWFYDTELHKKEILENYVATHMEQALQNQEFQLYLQPKMDLNRRELGGAEALVRWITPDGQTLFPDQFIPFFESNGFCARLDLYMFASVCRQLREWMDAGLEPIPLSINQSKLLFYESDYVQTLQQLTEAYHIPPQLITLEILEGLALEHVEELNEKITQLQALGFRLSMDDFGSGYSSLNTLGRLKIDELKLDRGFLLEASRTGHQRQRIIMGQIVELSKKLHISTVVEGVETQENEAFIRSLGCDYGQGYYYSRPLHAKDFTRQYMDPQGR